MLILTRKPGESLYIGDIKVTIVEIKGHQIRVGIDAPAEVRIYREEIYLQILEENRQAAQSSAGDSGLEGLSQAWHGGGDDADAKRKGKGLPGIKPKLSSLALPGTLPSPASDSAGRDPNLVVRRKKKDE